MTDSAHPQPASSLADDARKVAQALEPFAKSPDVSWQIHQARHLWPIAESLPGKIEALERKHALDRIDWWHEATSTTTRAEPASELTGDAVKLVEVLRWYAEPREVSNGKKAAAILPLAESLPERIERLETDRDHAFRTRDLFGIRANDERVRAEAAEAKLAAEYARGVEDAARTVEGLAFSSNRIRCMDTIEDAVEHIRALFSKKPATEKERSSGE